MKRSLRKKKEKWREIMKRISGYVGHWMKSHNVYLMKFQREEKENGEKRFFRIENGVFTLKKHALNHKEK